MVWVAASSSHKDSSDRIDIAQACARFLREAGRPLTRAEILERLRDWRGVGKHFQLHFEDEVFPVSAGVFGLRSRDLPVPICDIERMLDSAADALRERGVGLHGSELASLFAARGLGYAEKVSLNTFFAFAARDPRLQVDPAGYVGRAEWEGTRRLSIGAAARQLADEGLSQITAEEFRERLSALLGRSLSRMDATFALRDNGYTFDQHTKVWALPPDESVDGALDSYATAEDA